jgi:hypothetical protein
MCKCQTAGVDPRLLLPRQFLQLRDVYRDPPGLVLREQLGRPSPAGFVPRCCESGPEVIRPAPAFLLSAF